MPLQCIQVVNYFFTYAPGDRNPVILYNSQILIPEMPEFSNRINIDEIASVDAVKLIRRKDFFKQRKRCFDYIPFSIFKHDNGVAPISTNIKCILQAGRIELTIYWFIHNYSFNCKVSWIDGQA
jgi:hypothetical protein